MKAVGAFISLVVAAVYLMHRRSRRLALTLQLAASRGDLQAVKARLISGPILSRTRPNRMGDVYSAKPGFVANYSNSGKSITATDKATMNMFAQQAAEALAAATVAGHTSIVKLLLHFQAAQRLRAI